MRRVLSGAVLPFIAVVSNSLISRRQGWQSSASRIPTATPIKSECIISYAYAPFHNHALG